MRGIAADHDAPAVPRPRQQHRLDRPVHDIGVGVSEARDLRHVAAILRRRSRSSPRIVLALKERIRRFRPDVEEIHEVVAQAAWRRSCCRCLAETPFRSHNPAAAPAGATRHSRTAAARTPCRPDANRVVERMPSKPASRSNDSVSPSEKTNTSRRRVLMDFSDAEPSAHDHAGTLRCSQQESRATAGGTARKPPASCRHRAGTCDRRSDLDRDRK